MNVNQTTQHQSNRVNLERIIRNELIHKLEYLAGAIPQSFIEFLIDNSKLITVSKDQYLEESTNHEDGKLFYLHKGIARSYYYDNGLQKDVITRIWIKQDVIFDINSFQNKEDRIEAIQMLEDGEVMSIRYSQLHQLLEQYPKMVSCLLCLQAEQEKHAKFYQHLLKLNIEERVKRFLDRNPGITNRISHEHISLHLSMNRSRFSLAYQTYKLEGLDSSSQV